MPHDQIRMPLPGIDESPDTGVDGRGKTLLLLLAVLTPVVLFYSICFRYLLAVPHQDDYRTVLAFALDYRHQPTAMSKFLDILATQHNEYKYIFLHAVLSMEVSLTHSVDFWWLMGVGNLFLLPILWVFWRTAFPEEQSQVRRLALFLPVSLMMFSLNYWELMDFITAEWQYLPCLCFGLIALYLLTRPEHRRVALAGACGFAALSSLSSGNGFLLAPLGAIFLLRERRYVRALLWCSSFIMPLLAVLYRLVPATHLRAPLLVYPLYCLSFLGSALQREKLTIAGGAILVALMGVAAWRRFDRVNPCLFLLGMWILLTGPLVAYARSGYGLETSLAARYKVNSDLLLALAYVYVMHLYAARRKEPMWRNKAWLVFTALCVTFCGFGDRTGVHSFASRNAATIEGLSFYRKEPEKNTPMHVDPEYDATHPEEALYERNVLNEALRAGVYRLP